MCVYCNGEHSCRNCPALKPKLDELLEEDTVRVLSHVRSFDEARDGIGEDILPSLPSRQVNMCKRMGMEQAEFAKRSFADVVGSKSKRRRKNPKRIQERPRIDQETNTSGWGDEEDTGDFGNWGDDEYKEESAMVCDDDIEDSSHLLQKILDRLERIEDRLTNLESERAVPEKCGTSADDSAALSTMLLSKISDRLTQLESRLDGIAISHTPDEEKGNCFASHTEQAVEASASSMTFSLNCGCCGASFTKPEDLEQHISREHAFRCQVCRSFTCGSSEALESHMYMNHVGCRVCHQVFINEEAHNLHFVSSHRDVIMNYPSGKTSHSEARTRQ